MRRVVIVGSSGQDGRILQERLLKEGCEVFGIHRSTPGVHILNGKEVAALINDWKPQEVYYLAAFHHSSQDKITLDPLVLFQRSFDVHVTGLLHFLDAMRIAPGKIRLFYAASSHVFGEPKEKVQDEQTPFNPCCAYGITKTSGIHCCRFYRDKYGLFASSGILYNHESSYREEKFVSQKIIRGALCIQRGGQTKLVLGDLSAEIDWGYAPDFIDAMIRINALEKSDDFVIATGETHSVREFVEIAFGLLGLDWKKHVEENPNLLRRRKLPMAGNASMLRALTGWTPMVSFEQMIKTLLDAQRNGP